MDEHTRNVVNKHLARFVVIERILVTKGIVTEEELKAFKAQAEMEMDNALRGDRESEQ